MEKSPFSSPELGYYTRGSAISPMNSRRKTSLSKNSVGERSPLLSSSAGSSSSSSFVESTFNNINLLMGIGILSYPFALKHTGWIGVPLLLLLAGCTNYSAKLLGRCMGSSRHIHSFPDLGEAAFGTAGKIVFTLMLFLELFIAGCTGYLILEGDNLHKLFPTISSAAFMTYVAILVLPTCLTSNLGWLSYISALGVVASVSLFLAVLLHGLSSSEQDGSLFLPSPTSLTNDTENTALGMGLLMIGFGGHSVFPTIYDEMKDKSSWARSVNYTYVVVMSVYAGIAMAGYRMYGEDVEKEVTLNLENNFLGSVATWLIIINPITKFGITLNPLALALEAEVFKRVLSLGEADSRSTKRLVFSSSLRLALLSLTLITAICLPYFDVVMEFCGSFFAFNVSIVFPSACYLSLFYTQLSFRERALNYALCAFGLLCATAGTFYTIVSV